MLATIDLLSFRLDQKQLDLSPTGAPANGSELSVIVIGNDQILGGGSLTFNAAAEHHPVHECWGVSDLTMPHWAAMVGRSPDVRCLASHPGMSDAIRSTIERFHAHGAQCIRAEIDRRVGVLDAVSALGKVLQGTTLEAAPTTGRPGGRDAEPS